MDAALRCYRGKSVEYGMPLEYSSIRVFLVEYSTSGILVNNSGKVFWILGEFGMAMEDYSTVKYILVPGWNAGVFENSCSVFWCVLSVQ